MCKSAEFISVLRLRLENELKLPLNSYNNEQLHHLWKMNIIGIFRNNIFMDIENKGLIYLTSNGKLSFVYYNKLSEQIRLITNNIKFVQLLGDSKGFLEFNDYAKMTLYLLLVSDVGKVYLIDVFDNIMTEIFIANNVKITQVSVYYDPVFNPKCINFIMCALTDTSHVYYTKADLRHNYKFMLHNKVKNVVNVHATSIAIVTLDNIGNISIYKLLCGPKDYTKIDIHPTLTNIISIYNSEKIIFAIDVNGQAFHFYLLSYEYDVSWIKHENPIVHISCDKRSDSNQILLGFQPATEDRWIILEKHIYTILQV